MKNGFILISILISVCILAACGAGHYSAAGSDAGTGRDAAVPSVPSKKAIVSQEELANYSPEMKRIYDRGVLRVAIYSRNREPFFYGDDTGTLAGIDVELAADIAAQFGVGVEFIRTAQSFDEVVDQVASGQADIAVSKLSATLSRSKRALFSQPYLTLHQGLLVNRLKLAQLEQAHTTLLETIKNTPVKIGAVAGTSYVRFASERFPLAEIKQFQTVEEMMNAALKGDITAIFYDELQLKDMVENNPTHSIALQLIIMKDQIDPISIAIPPNQVQMLNWINLYLQINQSKLSEIFRAHGVRTEGSD
ncbi:Membrane-bound lytic murein transglycosylase F [Paenibacillus plantiphilus]|uniref:Membrane-bound lytic murein transglycosylase F n=1 Tax=Paenibacillus plantiphilus TaxID=2905650 RepID=A0ABM9CJV8_9BACL|nr:ABC transporter substrate-binding protein [Paenibacillus plantiphilus]CAH1216210.1 Membrane-bound lytic murein transglycosylase F [Paenibacillus plantiphilus]